MLEIASIAQLILQIVANAQAQGRQTLTQDEAATIQQYLSQAAGHTAGVLQAWAAAGPQ